MSGYGWNLSTQNPKGPYNPSQIACRICNQIFVSTKALIDHIETHMGEDVLGLTRQPNGLNLISGQRNCPLPPPTSPLSPNLWPSFGQTGYTLPSLQERRNSPMPVGNSGPVPRRSVFSRRLPPSSLRIRDSNHPSIGSQLQVSIALTQKKTMEDQPFCNCTTKPLIQQLDKPYSCEVEIINDDDLEMLDLTLKL